MHVYAVRGTWTAWMFPVADSHMHYDDNWHGMNLHGTCVRARHHS
jgi:hypothetical protein